MPETDVYRIFSGLRWATIIIIWKILIMGEKSKNNLENLKLGIVENDRFLALKILFSKVGSVSVKIVRIEGGD